MRTDHKNNGLEIRPAGYAYLLEKYKLTTGPHWHISLVSTGATHRSEFQNGVLEEIYPAKYWPGEQLGDHLEFALKYDGVNLRALELIFKAAPEFEITTYIKSKPTGKYTRKIWFFYEFLIEKKLSLEDVTTGNYIHALDPETCYAVKNSQKSQRHRVLNNLLGPRTFCPVIRKTEKLKKMDAIDWHKKCKDIMRVYPPHLFKRALNYLYHKETKSSFAIEHIKLKTSRTEKFIALLESAQQKDFCKKDLLLNLQNKIVDLRFKNNDYRTTQNYVGQTVSYQKEIIHFIAPKPDDLPDLMQGLLAAHQCMQSGAVPPAIHAAAIAYGFVFMHPFEDGNGRIHRFLIHNILSMQGMVPQGLIFPISAVMLKHLSDYDNSLEAFSKPRLQFMEYQLDDLGQMTIEHDTISWYQYIDMTPQAEALYDFIIKTIEEELVRELNFLVNYDDTKRELQNIIDMPDRLIDLFIQFCLQNHGRLSARKRKTYFEFLSDAELLTMEQSVASIFF